MTTDLRDFANQWIREGMTATQIDGFGPGSPPPPPLEFEDVDQGTLIRPEPEPEPELPSASPLLALAQADVARKGPPMPIPEAMRRSYDPTFTLSVTDSAASYKGQTVSLSKTDQAAIGRIILECAHRKLREQLAEVSKAAPRRVRKPKVHVGPIQLETAPVPGRTEGQDAIGGVPPPKKRRGRPPKVKE